MKKNISLHRLGDIQHIFKRPFSEVVFVEPKSMLEKISLNDENLTVHNYNFQLKRSQKLKNLSDVLNQDSYSQVYMTLEDKNIFYTLTGGSSRTSRARHNEMLLGFINDENLRTKVSTLILVSAKGILLANKSYDLFSFINHDVGSNWDAGRPDNEKVSWLLQEFLMPYSEREIPFGNNRYNKVCFYHEKLVPDILYKAVLDD